MMHRVCATVLFCCRDGHDVHLAIIIAFVSSSGDGGVPTGQPAAGHIPGSVLCPHPERSLTGPPTHYPVHLPVQTHSLTRSNPLSHLIYGSYYRRHTKYNIIIFL